MTIAIDVLNKVELALALVKELEEQPVPDSTVGFEFILGVSTDGLSSFELGLKGKKEGESYFLNVPADEANEYFGHNFPRLKQLLPLQIMAETIHLYVEIVSVEEADSREVVQSIARAAASCSCGGSGGCC